MPIPFEYPASERNITSLVQLMSYTNELVDGWLGAIILLVIGMVAFLSTKSYSYERAFGFSAFLVVICAILLRFMDLINDAVLLVSIVALIGAILILMKERSVEEP